LDFVDFIYLLKHGMPELHQYFLTQQNIFHDYCFYLAQNIEIQTVIYGEDIYPKEFYDMEDPPLIFNYLGSAAWLGRRNLSVVGSREPLALTLEWLETEFYEFAKKARICVVSGGARGVDQAAHRVAIRLGLPTIAILPSGLKNMYPRQIENWKECVLSSGGCFLSEFDFGEPMQKYHFDYRNRLIAALSYITMIAESQRRSGTLLTARHAARFGRTVLVVPGHPQLKNFSGSLDLLMDGASFVRDAQDLDAFFNSELRVVNE